VIAIGQRFGRLVTDAEVRLPVGSGRQMRLHYVCLCDCGAVTKPIMSSNLTSGRTMSCGCRHGEAVRENGLANKRHGHSCGQALSPTYSSWRSMRHRCANPRSPDFPDYGGRGITVCERWRSFDDFLADMGERPAGTTIDRAENDEGYRPGNCRWATPLEQRHNQRRCQ
jgi:hypothetical protein